MSEATIKYSLKSVLFYMFKAKSYTEYVLKRSCVVFSMFKAKSRVTKQNIDALGETVFSNTNRQGDGLDYLLM